MTVKCLLLGYVPPEKDHIIGDDEDIDEMYYYGTLYVRNLDTQQIHEFNYNVHHSMCPSGYTGATYEYVEEEVIKELPTHLKGFAYPLIEYVTDLESYQQRNSVINVMESSCEWYPDGNIEIDLSLFGIY